MVERVFKCREVYMLWANFRGRDETSRKDAAVSGPQGEIVPGSIAEIRYHRLGGLDQWVMIRGESVTNPPLILLHGGPGFPEMRLFRHFNGPLEKSFTVVYWEQRGTGKSFDIKIPTSSMTVERFIADLDELVDAVCKRLGKHKVAIYGHSWGSALGVLYAGRFPGKVAAYVGTGQIGDWPASELSSYEFTLAEAERRGNHRALKQLWAIGKPPHTYRKMSVQRKWLTRFVGIARGMSLWNFSESLSVVRNRRSSICPTSFVALCSARPAPSPNRPARDKHERQKTPGSQVKRGPKKQGRSDAGREWLGNPGIERRSIRTGQSLQRKKRQFWNFVERTRQIKPPQ